MTTLFYAAPELVIALNNKVIFANPHDLQLFKEVEIPADLTPHGLQLSNNADGNADAAGENQKKETKQKAPPTPEPVSIQHVALSPCHNLLAVTTTGQKALLLYQCRMEHAKLVSVRSLARASSALWFSTDSKSLLVTDKSGDCYLYDCEQQQEAPRLLLGHLSVVYDVLWTKDSKYIITCDRDDKIRVTNYPQTHDIHTYCLGHKEFVAGLAFLSGTAIASVSGDKTLRVWCLEKGEELAKIELPAPGIKLAVREQERGKFQAAILLHQPDECVGIYELTQEKETGSWKLNEREILKFPEIIPHNVCFVEERIYVSGVLNDRFALCTSALNEAAKPVPDGWLQMVEEQFAKEVWKAEDVSAWFKKRYDNVSEYLERKKRRIEEKQKQTQ